jgi:hypothetical protein
MQTSIIVKELLLSYTKSNRERSGASEQDSSISPASHTNADEDAGTRFFPQSVEIQIFNPDGSASSPGAGAA